MVHFGIPLRVVAPAVFFFKTKKWNRSKDLPETENIWNVVERRVTWCLIIVEAKSVFANVSVDSDNLKLEEHGA
jgi:hypothetical protein